MSATPASKLTGSEAAELEEAAKGVLDDNWSGTSTVPSPGLYPHQWSWDSAFVAIGRSWYDQERAQSELETLFGAQWANGMVPHIVFNPSVPRGDYFPGPDFWQADRASGLPEGIATSGITQPPLHAAAALEVYRHAADRPQAHTFLERLYPRLVAQHAYLQRWRDPDQTGLAALVHPWESGLDNSPAWDHPLADLEIPQGALPPYQRRDLVHANPADRPTDASYDRFVYLAARHRDAGYDDAVLLTRGPFLIEPSSGRDRHASWRRPSPPPGRRPENPPGDSRPAVGPARSPVRDPRRPRRAAHLREHDPGVHAAARPRAARADGSRDRGAAWLAVLPSGRAGRALPG